MDKITSQPELFKIVEIEEISVGDNLINLGQVLEIETTDLNYSLVISRQQQKQVFRFDKGDKVVILNGDPSFLF